MRRILVRAAGALVLGGLLVLGWAWHERARIEARLRTELEDAIAHAVGGSARIGRIEYHPLTLGAVFGDVDVVLDCPPARPATVFLGQGKVRLAWSTLAGFGGGRLRFRELVLTRPLISLDRECIAARASEKQLRAFDLSVDRLEISDGTMLYEDHAVPFAIQAEGVELRGEWDRARHALGADVRGRIEVTHKLLGRSLPLDVTTKVRLTPTRVELYDSVFAGPGVRLEGSGRVLFAQAEADESSLLFEGGIVADLDPLGPYLDPELPPFSGRVRGPFRAQIGPGPLRLHGQLEADAARAGPFTAQNGSAEADYREGRLELRGLSARSFGGRLTGDVSFDFSGPASFDARVEGRDLDLRDALLFTGTSLPLDGRADGTLRIAGELAQRRTWNGDGSFSIVAPGSARPATVVVTGEVALTFAGGRMTLRAPHGSLGPATLDATVEADLAARPPSGVVELAGETSSAARTKADVLTVLGGLDVTPPELLERPLEGSGTFRSRMSFGAARSLDVALDLRDGSWAEQPFDHAALQMSVADDRLVLRSLSMTRKDEALDASLAARLDPFALEQLTLRAAHVQLEPVLARFLPGVDAAGSLSGDLSLHPGTSGLTGSGALEIVDGRYAREPIDRIGATISVDEGTMLFSDVVANGPAGEVRGSVRTALDAGWQEVEIAGSRIHLRALEALRPVPLPLVGDVSLTGSLRRGSLGLGGSLHVDVSDATLGTFGLGGVAGGIQIENGEAIVSLGPTADATWALEGRVGFEGDAQTSVTLRMDRALVDLPLGAGAGTTWAIATGSAVVQGPGARPAEFTGSGSLEHVELHLGDVVAETIGAVPLTLEAGTIAAGPIHLSGQNSSLDASVRYGLDGGALDVTCAGRIDLGSAAALWPGIRASGSADVSVKVEGTVAQPRWTGTLQVHDGRVRAPALLAEPLEAIDLDVDLRDTEATIRRLAAVVGGGGVEARGHMAIVGMRPGPFDFEMDVEEVRIGYPTGFRGVYDGHVYLQGDAQTALLAGKLTLLRGAYEREFSAELGQSTMRVEPAGEIGTAMPTVYLNLDILGTDSVWVRNENAKVEAAVDLHIGGDSKRPEVTGRIRALEGGIIRLRDVDYRLLSASLDFTDLDRIRPYVDVKAETRVREYDISLSVEGPVDRFEYRLTSNPALSTQDIIALLTTGSTLEESQSAVSSGTGPGITSDVAADYVAGALTGGLERRLKKSLKLERVRIDPLLLQSQRDPTARITIGKRVADSVLLVYSTDLGSTEDQIYRAEWEATRSLRTALERDATGGVGGDIGYTTRFGKAGVPIAGEEAAAPAAPQPTSLAGPTVSEILIEGVESKRASELRDAIPLRTATPLRRSTLFESEEAIRLALLHDGWIEAKVQGESEPMQGPQDAVRVRFRVTPGPAVTVGVEGTTKKERRAQERRLAELWRESRFESETYADAVHYLRDGLRDRGYFAAQVDLVIEPHGETKNVRFLVDAGDVVEVQNITIEGASELSEARVREVLETRTSGAVSKRYLRPAVIDSDRAAVASLYAREGYLRAKIDPPILRLAADGRSADVTFRIDEGPRFSISGVEASDNTGLPADQVIGWSGLNAGQPFSAAAVRDGESRIRQKLDESGYPDARINTRIVTEANAVQLHIDLTPGTQRTVGSIAIVGAARTKEKIVRRELLLAPGDLASREKLVGSQQRLYRLGIFRNVRIDLVPQEGTTGIDTLRVRVEETKPVQLSVAAGYDTEAGPRGSFSLSHNNVGGHNRSLALQGAASAIYKRAQIVARDPRLFSRELQALFSIGWENQENVGFTQDIRSTAFRVEQKLPAGWKGFARYNFQRVDLEDVQDAIAVTEDKLENVQLGDVGYLVGRDRRDDPFLPTAGGYMAAELRLFAQPFLSESTFVKGTFQGSKVRTFKSGWQRASGIRLGAELPWGDTDEAPITERFFAGGDSTLRGFSRDTAGPQENGVPIGGQALLIYNEEWRYPIWRSLKGEFFYDGGNVWSRVGDARLGDLRHVLGTGVRFETAIGPIRFEYGRKLDRREGESSGEYFLSIGSAF